MACVKSTLYVIAVLLFFFALHVAAGPNAGDNRTTVHTVSFEAENDDTASIPDFDGDGTIGFGDFVVFAGVYGARQGDEKYESTYDLNDDGEIGFSDFVIFAQNFGKEAPSPVVAIPDANLRVEIEAALGKGSGAPITKAEMETLTDLKAGNADISDLSGLEHAVNLKELELPHNKVSDLAPLSGLSNLARLHLWDNHVTDISALSGLTNLTYLWLSNNNVKDITGLSGLSNLGTLSLWFNDVTDLDPLAGLTNLTHLSLGQTPTTDVSALKGLTNLVRLGLQNVDVSNVSVLAGLTRLKWLDIRFIDELSDLSPLSGLIDLNTLYAYGNNISDVAPLSNLTSLKELTLTDNNISDLSPLAANTGLTRGDIVDVTENPLNAESIRTHIPALQARGVMVSFDEIVSFAGAQIYNDNVSVLPVAENLAAGKLPLEDYAQRFYGHFSDEFDFLMFVPNLPIDRSDPGAYPRGVYMGVKNDVQDIGESIFFDDEWGSPGQLQGVILFGFSKFPKYADTGHSVLIDGPSVHELMHRWANFIVPPFPHWAFNSADGILGGLNINSLVEHGGGRYSADEFSIGGWADNFRPYSPIELYLAGLIPSEEVPDLWVAEDGEALLDESGSWDGMSFVASRIDAYTIEDIIAKHGRRVPDHSGAQKRFRAAVILLISDAYPATREFLETLGNDVNLFSQEGENEFQWYNFYEATGGRATITMEGLSQFRRSAGSKIVVPGSFGTPPPPIVDHWER